MNQREIGEDEVEMDDAASKGDTREVDDGWQWGCSTTTIQQSIDEMEMELCKNERRRVK